MDFYFKNCYVVENDVTKETFVCHFDEISYFKIRKYDEMICYYPVLKNNDSHILGVTNHEGHKIFRDYLIYKNGL